MVAMEEKSRRRAPAPTGWRASGGWFTNLAEDAQPISSWSRSRGITPRMDAANNAGVVPQERACIHALTHTAPESLPNNDIDDAYVRLCKTFGGDRTNYEPLHTMPDGILTIRGFMWRIYELFTDCECRDDCTGMVAAADAAADALRTALKAGTASYCTMYLAFKILQFLPPFISVRHHAVVAEMLADGSPDIMAFAAHTLACMGPEAVAEHFEEIVSIAGADPGTSVVTHRFSYASAAAAGMLVRNECTTPHPPLAKCP